MGDEEVAAAAFLASITEADCVERELPEDDPKWIMGRPTAELREMCEMHGDGAEETAELSRLDLVRRIFLAMFASGVYAGEESEEDTADEDDQDDIDDDIHD